MTESDFLLAFNQPLKSGTQTESPFQNATRPAAVLICLCRQQDQLHILFTQRASHLKHHGGQISFPGGKAELSDVDLVDTAYREAAEEIGIDRSALKLLGQISTYKTVSGFEVTPIIAMYNKKLNLAIDLNIDQNEVADVFSVPLSHLMNPSNYLAHNMQRGGLCLPVYFIRYQAHTIWGATAGMLVQLQQHVSNR